MKHLVSLTAALALVFFGSPAAYAFTVEASETVLVDATGSVTASTTFAIESVSQGTGEPGTPADLTFGTGGNSFRDSDEAIRVEVDTNLAANRVIVYTDNLNGSAVPQFSGNTANGIDGGGLVGVTDTTKNLPMLFVVLDANDNHVFTTGTIGDDETFVTDRAHVATFVTPSALMDDLDLEKCDAFATLPVAIDNTNGDGLYSQYFGTSGQNHDMCLGESGPLTLFGQGPGGSDIENVEQGDKVPAAEELSKNIAVVAFGFLGTAGTSNVIASVTSPIFVPIGVDFSDATAQSYGTSTLTFELVTQ